MHFGGLYLKVNDSIIAMANRGVAKYKNTLLYFNNTNPTCTNLQYFFFSIFCILRLGLYPSQSPTHCHVRDGKTIKTMLKSC
jgi:hypothetical protein